MAIPESLSPMDLALFVIPFVTAPLSLLSSAYIVYLIVSQRKNNKRQHQHHHHPHRSPKPREHILLGMSLLDISFSFALSFSTIPAPAIMDEALPTLGTVGTCTAQGFFVQIGLGAPLYNACLCIYYLLRVRYRVSDDYLMEWAVPAMHGLILTFALTTAVASVVMDLFNYAGVMGCWIHNAEALCIDDPQYCDRGQRAEEFEIYFALLHIVLCFIFVSVSMGVLWWTVRQTELKSRQWRFGDNNNNNNNINSNDLSSPSAAGEAEVFSPGEVTITPATATSDPPPRGGPSSLSMSKKTTSSKRPLPLTRQTMETGLLFSATFISVWIPSILLGLASFFPSLKATGVVGTLRIAAVTLQPLQGFFNMLIYTAPQWMPWVRRTMCCCCCCCCCCDTALPLTSTTSSPSSHRREGLSSSRRAAGGGPSSGLDFTTGASQGYTEPTESSNSSPLILWASSTATSRGGGVGGGHHSSSFSNHDDLLHFSSLGQDHHNPTTSVGAINSARKTGDGQTPPPPGEQHHQPSKQKEEEEDHPAAATARPLATVNNNSSGNKREQQVRSNSNRSLSSSRTTSSTATPRAHRCDFAASITELEVRDDDFEDDCL